jgi:hypothetical protein
MGIFVTKDKVRPPWAIGVTVLDAEKDFPHFFPVGGDVTVVVLLYSLGIVASFTEGYTYDSIPIKVLQSVGVLANKSC